MNKIPVLLLGIGGFFALVGMLTANAFAIFMCFVIGGIGTYLLSKQQKQQEKKELRFERGW